jgi:hypothetical protein
MRLLSSPQVCRWPEETSSIADRICQKRHHDWIEAYLLQHQQVVA